MDNQVFRKFVLEKTEFRLKFTLVEGDPILSGTFFEYSIVNLKLLKYMIPIHVSWSKVKKNEQKIEKHN